MSLFVVYLCSAVSTLGTLRPMLLSLAAQVAAQHVVLVAALGFERRNGGQVQLHLREVLVHAARPRLSP